jgi:hypothetical protein
MDMLWLLAEDEKNREGLGELVGLLEDREYGNYGEALYEELLPTLGQRGIPILRVGDRRTRRAADRIFDRYHTGDRVGCGAQAGTPHRSS